MHSQQNLLFNCSMTKKCLPVDDAIQPEVGPSRTYDNGIRRTSDTPHPKNTLQPKNSQLIL